VFENRVLRRIFGPKRDEVTGVGENYIIRRLMICTHHPILFRRSNREEYGRGMQHVRGRGVYRVLVEKPERKRLHLEDPGVDGGIRLSWNIRKWDVG
jgi:hypothetical protein